MQKTTTIDRDLIDEFAVECDNLMKSMHVEQNIVNVFEQPFFYFTDQYIIHKHIGTVVKILPFLALSSNMYYNNFEAGFLFDSIR